MVGLVRVKLEEKSILSNLLEKYLYEFSRWTNEDIREDGLYGYQYLDCYWTEANRFPYFVKVDGKIAGFILVNDYPEVPNLETDFCMSEFFILLKYRKKGYGREATYGDGTFADVILFDNKECPCKKKRCQYHGRCDECRAHHECQTANYNRV